MLFSLSSQPSVIKMDPDQLTLRLGLSQLEREGGWCRELGVRTDRTSSSIFYMLRSSDTTAWHRLAAVNEFWCHHQGANIRWGLSSRMTFFLGKTRSYLTRTDCYISDCRRSLAMVATPPPSWEELGPAACLSTVLRGTLGSKLI